MSGTDFRRFTRHFTIREDFAGLGKVTIAASFVLPTPDQIGSEPTVLFCFPGGAMNKGYFDIDANGDRSFSFAEAVAQRGIITVSLDHPGVGESSRPEDSLLLHPDTVAAVDHAAIVEIKRAFLAGILDYPAIARFRSVGVGHSMGGMLTGLVQARFQPYDAVVILGSGPYGLYAHLPDDLKPLAGDPEAARRELIPRLRAAGGARFAQASQPAGQRSDASRSFFHGGDRRGVEAMRAARSELITVPASFGMIPGAWGPDAAAIRVPLLLVFGDQDICKDPHSVPAFFTATTDLSLVVLPETGHSHFIFPARTQLFHRVPSWVEDVTRSGIRSAHL